MLNHHPLQREQTVGRVGTHNDSFARRQPRRFDDHTGVARSYIGPCFRKARENSRLRRGDAHAFHKFLCVGLFTLDSRRGLGRPEDAKPRGLEAIDDPRAERPFRSDDGQPDFPFACESQERLMILNRDGDVFKGLRRPRVARCAENRSEERRVGKECRL